MKLFNLPPLGFSVARGWGGCLNSYFQYLGNLCWTLVKKMKKRDFNSSSEAILLPCETLCCPRLTLAHLGRADQLTNQVLLNQLKLFLPHGLVGSEMTTLWSWMQCLNPLSHTSLLILEVPEKYLQKAQIIFSFLGAW